MNIRYLLVASMIGFCSSISMLHAYVDERSEKQVTKVDEHRPRRGRIRQRMHDRKIRRDRERLRDVKDESRSKKHEHWPHRGRLRQRVHEHRVRSHREKYGITSERE